MQPRLLPFLVLALAALAALPGCSDDRARLAIDVRTDAIPGVEFLSVETEVFRGASLDQGLPAVRYATAASPLGTAFARGRRVASFEGLPWGTYTVRARLVRGDSRTPLLTRRVLLELRGDRVLTITLDRGCLEVECPGEGDVGGRTECVGGRCVEPSCVPPDPTGCEGLVLCGVGAPCAVETSSCAQAACEDGVCLALPIAGACEATEYCEPDEGGGCRTPGEEVESLCNTICTTGIDAGCETGYWNCSRGEPFCDPFIRRPVGDECDEGVCDGAGRCVDCDEGAGCVQGCARGTYRCDAAGGGARCELDGSVVEPGERCAVDGSTCVDGQPCATDGLCAHDGACVPDGTAGVIVGPAARRLVTTEAGGTAQLTVQLTTEPLHPVTIDLTTDEPGEVAIEPPSIVISPGTGTMPRVITLRGLDDGVLDDDRPFVVRFAVASSDARYDGFEVSGVAGVNRALELTCADGTANCDGLTSNACEADLGSDATCGACDVSCAGPLANGVEGCGITGCALACDPGFASCDESVATGCEIDVRSSLEHCGGCDRACAHANAASRCDEGVCSMGACSDGFGNCDASAATGCETDVRSSLDHCGACGRACAHENAASRCDGGVCSMGACSDGFGNCDASAATGCETDVRSSLDHCGGCGRACAHENAASRCDGGVCSMGACSDGFGNCDASAATGCETDVRSSLDHCGGCGRACEHANASSACDRGVCSMGDCSDGFADCDADPATGCEIDVTSSPLHCGGCGKVCPTFPNARPACESSMCTFGSCEEGWVDCNRSQADGCELRLGGECSPNEYPCFDTALSCDAERSRPVCTPGEPLPERTPCFETGMCDGRGQCMCRPGAEVNERCGPEHVCDPDGLCVRNVQWYTVDCATAPEGLSGHEICRLLGFGGLARTANGWWWGECGGPNGSTGGVDNCVEYDAEGTRCLSFCASDARSVDCTGAPLCGEDRPIELLDDGEKRFVPSQYADCRDGNPGWSVRVQCVFN